MLSSSNVQLKQTQAIANNSFDYDFNKPLYQNPQTHTLLQPPTFHQHYHQQPTFSSTTSHLLPVSSSCSSVPSYCPQKDSHLLFTANCRGSMSALDRLANQYNVNAIVHIGNFGFIERASLTRMSDDQLRSFILSTTPSNHEIRDLAPDGNIKSFLTQQLLDSVHTELNDYMSGKKRFSVPVYVVPGPLDDSVIIQKIASNPIPNLYIISQCASQLIEMSTVKFRLFPAPASLNLFNQDLIDYNEAAGFLTRELEHLFDESDCVFDASEIRILLNSGESSGNDLYFKLASHLKADYLISTGPSLIYQPIVQHSCDFLVDFSAIKASIFSRISDNTDPKRQAVGNRIISLWNNSQIFTSLSNFMFSLPNIETGHFVFNVNSLQVSHIIIHEGLNLADRLARQVGAALNSLKVTNYSSPQANWSTNTSNTPTWSNIVEQQVHAQPTWIQQQQQQSQQQSFIHSRANSNNMVQQVQVRPDTLQQQQFPQQTYETIEKLSTDNASDSSGEGAAPEHNGMTVWVGNLPENVTEIDLKNFFRNVPVLRIKLTNNRPDKRPCAFVEVPDSLALEGALRLGGERLYGYRLKVEYDPSRLKKEYGLKGPKTSSGSSSSSIAEGPSLSAGWGIVKTVKEAVLPDAHVQQETPLVKSSWDSPPRKDNKSFSTGAKWDKPAIEVVKRSSTAPAHSGNSLGIVRDSGSTSTASSPGELKNSFGKPQIVSPNPQQQQTQQSHELTFRTSSGGVNSQQPFYRQTPSPYHHQTRNPSPSISKPIDWQVGHVFSQPLPQSVPQPTITATTLGNWIDNPLSNRPQSSFFPSPIHDVSLPPSSSQNLTSMTQPITTWKQKAQSLQRSPRHTISEQHHHHQLTKSCSLDQISSSTNKTKSVQSVWGVNPHPQRQQQQSVPASWSPVNRNPTPSQLHHTQWISVTQPPNNWQLEQQKFSQWENTRNPQQGDSNWI